MKTKLKVTSAVFCTVIFASLLALSGCDGEPESGSSTPSSQTTSTVSDPVVSFGSEPVSSTVSEPSRVSSDTSAVSSSLSVDPANQIAGAVKESPKVDSSYFDDAVFIGDSVSNKLKLYATRQRKTDPSCLGKAQFLTAGSLGIHNALWDINRSDSVHPAYEGKKALLEDSIAAMKAKKVYIMLGMNDIAVYGIDDSVKSMETLINNILAKSPDANIYIQSATPILTGFEGKKLNNAALTEYNQKMAQFCQEKGYAFVDVASVMKDENGNLIRAYCSDYDTTNPDNQGIHFTDEGCKVWIDYLYTHTV